MKISSQEEYGLRILLRIAQFGNSEGITIPQLSEEEGISEHYVAKLCRLLRLAGYINSTRGKEGGYSLAIPADQIKLSEVIGVLGGKLYSSEFCKKHSGFLQLCTHTSECSVRSVWHLVQNAVDQVLEQITIQDLIKSDNTIKQNQQQAEKEVVGVS